MRKILVISLILASISTKYSASAQTNTDYETKGDLATAEADYLSASSNYTKALSEKDPDKNHQSILYNKLALSFRGLKQYEKAIADFSLAISLNPAFLDAYWNRAVAYDISARYQMALNDYQHIIPLLHDDQNLSNLYNNVAYDALQLHQPEKALQADSTSMALDPHNIRAYELKGDIHLALNQYKTAINDYTTAMTYANPNDNKQLSALYTQRADAEGMSKQNKEAINDYSLAILMTPDFGPAYWNRAVAYHNNGDYKLAAGDYSKAMPYYQDDTANLAKLYDNRAINEAAANLLAASVKDDSIAISLDPKNKGAYLNTANAYTQSGDYQLSIDWYKKLIAFPEANKKITSEFYFQIATDEYFLNEFDKVITDCTKAISLDPENPEPYFYRGKVYFKKLNSRDKAMKDFNKVLALDTSRKSVNYVFSLLYLGRGDEAVAILQNDLLSSNNSLNENGDYYNLACLYSLMNKPDEANIYLKKAIDNGYAKKYAIADEDLDNIRQTDDYKSTIAGAAN